MSGLSVRAALILAGGAIFAAALVPVSAQAARIAAVKISDGKHVAKVSTSGALQIGDGSGPLTVDGSVTAALAAPLSIAGTVPTRATIPGTPLRQTAVYNGSVGVFMELFTTTTNQTAYVSSITLSLESSVATAASPAVTYQRMAVVHGPAAMDCADPGPGDITELMEITTSTSQTTHLEFPTPLVVSPSNAKTCLVIIPALASGSSAVFATVLGYLA